MRSINGISLRLRSIFEPSDYYIIRETSRFFWIILKEDTIKFRKRKRNYSCREFECNQMCHSSNEKAEFRIKTPDDFIIHLDNYIVNEKFENIISTFYLSKDGLTIQMECENVCLRCNFLDKSPSRDIHIIFEEIIRNDDCAFNYIGQNN